MAVEIEIFPRRVQTLGGGAGSVEPTAKPGKALSASFAEMMAAAERGGEPAPAGPKPLSTDFAAMMAAVDGASAAEAARPPAPRDLDPRQRAVDAPPGTGGGIDFYLFGKDGLTFGDIIDVINPLQHIPIVGTIYRWLTGDEISPASSLAGGFLFGGPIGLAASAVNVVVEEATGDDIGGNVMTTMFGESPLKDQINLADAPAEERSWGVADAGTPPAAAPQLAVAPRGDGAAPQAAPAPAPPRPAPTAAATSTAAPAPATEAEAMTLSEDQLAMLLSKGAGKRTLKPLPPPGPPAKTPPAAKPPAIAAEGDAAVSTKMMSALDKYEAMLKARASAGQAPASAGAIGISA
jgi:hypothetical protein